MSEDDPNQFDPTLKKKKKKKKIDFENIEDGGGAELAVTVPEAKDEPTPEPVNDTNFDDELLLKKKKKKKKVFDMSDLKDGLEEGGAEENGTTPTESADIDADMDFTLSKKKKKKKVKIMEDVDVNEDEDKVDNEKETAVEISSIWSSQNDKDYSYDELLLRVFDTMRERNPDMMAGEKKRFVMKPPQVMRVGTKKSSFTNFADICRMLHRQPKHLLAFLLAELGTSGSIDGNNQLIIKGKYQQKQIENVLRKYIKEYVTCHTCRSPDTFLQKDTRLYFLQCETCGSRCSVSSIKSGFQAVTGKRSAIRAKTA